MKLRPAQNLLEMMIAIGVIMVTVFGTISLIISTITASRISQNRIEATNLAREGIEAVRSIRDSNWLKRSQNVKNLAGTIFAWDENLSAGNWYAVFIPTTGWTLSTSGSTVKINLAPAGYYTQENCGGCVGTKYSRQITIAKSSDTVSIGGSSKDIYFLDVSVKVSWSDRLGGRSLTAREKLYDWK